jgi:predicted AAA+ superfamily ATPase
MWKIQVIKGFYDTNRSEILFIITGSSRLDYYSKGGDSLHGRYHYYRLHPFPSENSTLPPQKIIFRHY